MPASKQGKSAAAQRATKKARAARKAKTTGFRNVTFDARPDRLDFRDLPYRPPLDSLEPRYPHEAEIKRQLPAYGKDKLILDQGMEGACTGYGLACVINYLFWIRHRKAGKRSRFDSVSPRMLYELARHYDEWPGEDYEGSSCRGALKGWHKHGVCTATLWPYMARGSKSKPGTPKKNWDKDAVTRPLGVYYRVDKDSVVDMQAAIQDIGAIYVSARVHDGWDRVPVKTAPKSHADIPLIPPRKGGNLGGHAFAIVGYNEHGFIVQNSWGKSWGGGGFAIMSYGDWVAYGTDVWAVALGVPQTYSEERIASLRWPAPSGRSLGFLALDRRNPDNPADDPWPIDRDYNHKAYQPWSTARAYEHTLVTGNDGRIIVTDLASNSTLNDFIEDLVVTRPLAWHKRVKPGTLKVALYAHGGLNSEHASIERIRVMAPYFEANGIYPLFLTWRTGPFETIRQSLADKFRGFFGVEDEEQMRAAGFADYLAEQRDRRVEELAHTFIKGMWSEMRENARRSAHDGHGLDLLAKQLQQLKDKLPAGKLEIHLVGHSAGSILLGHLLPELVAAGSGATRIAISTCSLYAAACSVKFAIDNYLDAGEPVLDSKQMFLHYLSDRNEKADFLAGLKHLHLYGKSLLYLVSRALDDARKIPLLGLERAVTPGWHRKGDQKAQDQWANSHIEYVRDWQTRFKGKLIPVTDTSVVINRQDKTQQAIHGSFDNNIKVISTTIERIAGRKPVKPLEWLDY